MDLNNISFYENVIPQEGPISEGILLVVNDVLKLLDQSKPVTFCPFCTTSFSVRLDLENHLKIVHHKFLDELLVRSVQLDNCPFCCGKFYTHHLVAKHALIYHGNVIFDAYFARHCNMLHCLFCQAVVEQGNMVGHVENLHYLQYNDWFTGKFCLQSGGVAGLVEVLPGSSLVIQPSDIDELSKKIKGLQVKSNKNVTRSILKNKKEGLCKRQKLPVRRELRFELLEKENMPPATKNKTTVSDEMKIEEIDTWTSTISDSSFQCGKCFLCFVNYSQLLLHVKKDHKKLLSLKPLYQCALCGARFYNSKYFSKHNDTHTSRKLR